MPARGPRPRSRAQGCSSRWSGLGRIPRLIESESDAISGSLKSTAQGASDRYENAGADESRNQIADPAGKIDAEEAEQPIGDRGPYDAEHDVHQNAHWALHELLGQPAGKPADDDRRDPANLFIVHWVPPARASND